MSVLATLFFRLYPALLHLLKKQVLHTIASSTILLASRTGVSKITWLSQSVAFSFFPMKHLLIFFLLLLLLFVHKPDSRISHKAGRGILAMLLP